ncbi:MAG: hypothetical protein N4A38_00290 [Candidatus Gracilibacteria bacterium]|nr:hypothetical protein [Candidatus Gracilibacteria bacterium]
MEKEFYIAKYDGEKLVYKSEKFTWTESQGMTFKQFINYCMHQIVQRVGILSRQAFSVIPV